MKLGVIPGDGIGPEVIGQALSILKYLIPELEYDSYDFGAARYLKTGEILQNADLEQLKKYDALLLGAIGDPRIPSGILERGFLLALRFAFDHHINLRPFKSFPTVPTPLSKPDDIDFIVVREGTEGAYTGNGGAIRTDTAQEIATETSVNTRFGVERVVRYAFALAQQRRKQLTWVHKTNVLVFAGDLWRRTIEKVATEFPEVAVNYAHIDAATIYMVTDPARFDVIVTDNLFGDIITDLAAAVTGGIGLAASGNIDSSGTYPAMFEPVHGSAPDIAGTNTADPIAAIASIELLLSHLGFAEQAERLKKAIAQELASRFTESLSTTAVGDRVLSYLAV